MFLPHIEHALRRHQHPVSFPPSVSPEREKIPFEKPEQGPIPSQRPHWAPSQGGLEP